MPDPSAESYAQALEFLYGRINYELAASVPYHARELNLDRMRWLLDRVGNPHLRFPVVHIAGTKGKGSTAAMISAVLVAAGYRVGLYTSPHLVHLEERFAIDGEPCSPQELVELTQILRDALPDPATPGVDSPARLTFFDMTTALALLHFARRQVDLVVLEVGMGGRLDSTNICQPLISVITSISFDHMKQLGNTLAAIAGEKAGIIKQGIPVVSGVTAAEPATTIARIAAERHARLYQRDRDFFAEYIPIEGSRPGGVSYHESEAVSSWRLDRVPLAMLGRHQARNAGVALATLNRLRESGWKIDDSHCLTGLANARCPARIEVVSSHPTVIIDTAHNDASIEALTSTLEESFSAHHRVLLFAVARDKDVRGMLQQLLPQFHEVILTQFVNNPRGLPVDELAAVAREVSQQLQLPVRLRAVPTPRSAWEACLDLATPASFICVTGSFFLAAEISQLFASAPATFRPEPCPLTL